MAGLRERKTVRHARAAPAVGSGDVLVRNHYSFVSMGTEKMKVSQARMSLAGKAKERPDQVKLVLNTLKEQGLIPTLRKVQKRLKAPTTLGSSCGGTVVAVGSQVDEFRVGDRVACIGEGVATHAEYNAVPRNLVVRVPDNVSLEAASSSAIRRNRAPVDTPSEARAGRKRGNHRARAARAVPRAALPRERLSRDRSGPRTGQVRACGAKRCRGGLRSRDGRGPLSRAAHERRSRCRCGVARRVDQGPRSNRTIRRAGARPRPGGLPRQHRDRAGLPYLVGTEINFYTESFLVSAQALLAAQRSMSERRIITMEPRFPFTIG